jgi:hypothetical protein
MSYEGMNMLVKPGNILVNYHYPNMGSQVPIFVSVFRRHHEFIREDVFERDGDNVKFIRYRCYNQQRVESSKKTSLNSKDGKPLKWKNFVENNIPSQIMYYGGYFPSFTCFKYDEWKKSIKNTDYPLIGISDRSKTVKAENGKIGSEGVIAPKTSDSIRSASPFEFVRKCISGEFQIEISAKKK